MWFFLIADDLVIKCGLQLHCEGGGGDCSVTEASVFMMILQKIETNHL